MDNRLTANSTLQYGKYRIVRVLGQGGFGITYLAVQVRLDRQVAIKEFYMEDYCGRNGSNVTAPTDGSYASVNRYRMKFIKEARKLATLHHPNIVEVLDIFEENNTVYYVMTYQQGGSLQDYMNRYGKMSEQSVRHYIKQIASALDYMHAQKHMCHYDVKPGNIMLDGRGNALLIDFGLAKGYDDNGMQTSTTPIGLSMNFAPIEQYQQNVEEFSPESDIYSLGATTYYLLTGKLPPSAINRASGSDIDYSELSVNEKFAIRRAMAISKNYRWHTASEFVKELYSSESYTASTMQPRKKKMPANKRLKYCVLTWLTELVLEGIIIYKTNFQFLGIFGDGLGMMIWIATLIIAPIVIAHLLFNPDAF